MSSSVSERTIPTINEGLPIPELIKLIKHSFRECEFNEVQNILMDREKNMKIEMENLMRDCGSMKEEVRLLERSHGLAELEKLKTEEKLERSQRKCEELKETVTRLIEEKRVSSDRQKRADEGYDKLCLENSKMATEKDKLILELNEKINELKNENLESERLVGVYQERLKCSDATLVTMGKEIEDLKQEKLAANQTLEELRRKQLEADQVVEKLKRQIVEANQNIDELRQKSLESDKAAELYKSRLEKLAPRIMRVEKELASMLKVKVEDLGNVVDSLDKYAGVMEENVDFIDLKGEKDSLGNGSAQWNGDASKKGPHALGMHLDDEVPVIRQTTFGAGCSSKIVHSSSAAGDIIEISDSDDETNPSGAAYIPDIVIGANAGENELIVERFVQSPFSSQTKKRNRTDCREDSLINDEASTDSDDESCSDSCMEDLIATLQSKKLGRKWMFEADMLKAFQEDEELCMDAVCALYRQQIFARKSTKSSNSSKNVRFRPDDSMSGRALAEYLIDGDKELRLRKSVSDVKQQRPEVLSQCQRLAAIYHEKLYYIYCSGKDPFFGQR